MDKLLQQVKDLCAPITMECFGTTFTLRIDRDNKYVNGRIFIQVQYEAPCTKTGKMESWSGGKHYLSDHMTEDEIVKRCWVAFEAAVKHEVMEGFKYSGIIVFNPHVNFLSLLAISHEEVKREAVTI